MTIFSSNSIFQPVQKYLKYYNTDIAVVNGANKVNALPLCGIKINYEQYQRISVSIPKGQVDFVLSFPMLGIKTTFITIKPTYCGVNPDQNYLKWKFQPSGDAKWSFTSILTLTGTSTNPIPPILIDNPNPDCVVQLDILVSAMENDYLNDNSAFLYLNELTFDKVHTYNETNSEILAFFNKDGVLAGTLDIVDIVNISRVPGQNRIIIDESSESNIVLDFLTEYDTLQALSAINWVLLDPTTRALPQAADITPPAITYTNRVNTLTSTIDFDLSLYPLATINKQDFINAAILGVTDNRDGSMMTLPNNIVFKSGVNPQNTILAPGTYTAEITISDIAGNITTQIINMEVYAVIVDITPPVINFTGSVTGLVINPIDTNAYPTGFSANDARVLCITNVVDDTDGMIPLASVAVVFKDAYGVTVPSIPFPSEGDFTVQFTVLDAALNMTTTTLSLHVNDPLVNTAPQINFTGLVTLPALTAAVSLSVDYGSGIGTFTATDAISTFITDVTDDIDGIITLTPINIIIKDALLVVVPAILTPGIYTVEYTAVDTAFNTTVKTITLTVNP
jgi:hypothetical protein